MKILVACEEKQEGTNEMLIKYPRRLILGKEIEDIGQKIHKSDADNNDKEEMFKIVRCFETDQLTAAIDIFWKMNQHPRDVLTDILMAG